MCTVSYVPKRNGFILVSNRDENPERHHAHLPKRYEIKGKGVYCPLDPVSKGTWIATCEDCYTLCLLNGAFVAHEKKEKYKHSRGKVLIDFFTYANESDFISSYDFVGIEPFTLLIVNKMEGISFSVLRWDGLLKHVEKLSAKKVHIFSSSTLYSDDVKNKRKEWLEAFLEKNSKKSLSKMLKFHTHTEKADPVNGLIINRSDKLKTISVCGIDFNKYRTEMVYIDLLKSQKHTYRILHLKTCSTNGGYLPSK